MLILCLILIRLSVNMTCFCPCCYSCYCCSCCSDDSLLHAGIRPLVQGDRKRMICMAHTMLLEKPSPIKHPVECLARGICSARLISPVEMVLLFFSHVSVTSGLKGTLNIYSLLIYFFFLSFFLFFFLKKAFWKAFKRSMLLLLLLLNFCVPRAPNLLLESPAWRGNRPAQCCGSPHPLAPPRPQQWIHRPAPGSLLPTSATSPSLSRVFITLKGVLRLLKNTAPPTPHSGPTVFNMGLL